jgi:quinol-cytochrome oxidoreductase complex cytochrome b subunit
MNFTRLAQRYVTENMAMEDALPTKMPVYVNSVAYLFGVTSLSALALTVLTGLVLALYGPGWYHHSSIGRFFNSWHIWSVQIFFFALLTHVFVKYCKAAWRGGRWPTWVSGVLLFGAAVFTGLTGYLSQLNWDSQWIAVQSKDAMNSVGLGAYFNTMNGGQVIALHISVLPLAVVALAVVHVLYVRRDSPVRPL